MQSLNHYLQLTKRWMWLILLGIIICGSLTYFFSKLVPPVYQASAIIVVTVGDPSSNGPTSSIAAVPTYAQLITNPLVLNPVVAQHPGMSLQQLNAMIAVKPQASTQLIELDVQNGNAQLAKQLANEIGQSFEQYANGRLPGAVVVWPAQEPPNPVSPKPSLQAGIGALIGLTLAIALIFFFEWIEDRPGDPEAVQALLEMDILTTLPSLRKKEQGKKVVPSSLQTESYLRLCANLAIAQQSKPFKLLMITSALESEGKSVVAANLASCLANLGKRVLLVDANMRHPELHQLFQLRSNNPGLSNVFVEKWPAPKKELYGQETDIQTLRVLPAGILSSNPAEVLQTPLAHQVFEYYKQAPFDYVLFDTPPLLPVVDAQILSTLSGAVLVVVDITKVSRRALSHAKDLLNRMPTMRLGIVVNRSRWSDYGQKLHYSGRGQQFQTHVTLNEISHTPSPSSTLNEQSTPSEADKQSDPAPTIRLERKLPKVVAKPDTPDKQTDTQPYSALISSPVQRKPPMSADPVDASFHDTMKPENTSQACRKQQAADE